MTNEAWIAIGLGIAGTVIGYAIPYLVRFITFAASIPFRTEILTGTWHSYHFSRIHGESVLRYEHWTITRNWLNRLMIKTVDPGNLDLIYRGSISLERNYLLIQLRGVRHKEEVQMRFFDIIPTSQDIAFGLAMGIDFDNEAQALVRIMSRNELTSEEARSMLLSKTLIKEPGILSILR